MFCLARQALTKVFSSTPAWSEARPIILVSSFMDLREYLAHLSGYVLWVEAELLVEYCCGC